MSNPLNTPTSDFLTIMVDGTEHKLFMSFALLQSMAKQFPDPQSVVLMPIDPDAREIVVNLVFKNEVPELTLNAAEQVVQWAAEHLVSFFVRQTELMTTSQQTLAPMMKNLLERQQALSDPQSSPTGSTN